MSYKQLLQQRFFIEDINNTRYLIEKHDGRISTLNPTASILVDLFLADFSKDEAIKSIAQATKTTVDSITPAVTDFIRTLEKQNTYLSTPETYIPTKQAKPFSTGVAATYCINNTYITVQYSNEHAFKENDVLLSTMRCENTVASKHLILVYETENYTDIFIDGEAKIGTKDQAWVNGLLRSCLIELAYKNIKTLMTLHAAGAVYNNKALLFAGPSGAGKSTLATHLCIQGYGYRGDDSIPIDLDNNCAYCLPTALSLKEGSWGLFNSLHNEISKAPLQRQFVKPMKAITPPNKALQNNDNPTIKALVFSQFDPNSPSILQTIDLNQALPLIEHAETKFNPDNIEQTPLAMLRWLNHIPCYTMRYRSLEDAEQYVNNLLKSSKS